MVDGALHFASMSEGHSFDDCILEEMSQLQQRQRMEVRLNGGLADHRWLPLLIF